MSALDISESLSNFSTTLQSALSQPETYTQLGMIVVIYTFAFFVSRQAVKYFPLFKAPKEPKSAGPLKRFAVILGHLVFPLLAILMLRIFVEVSTFALEQSWLLNLALSVAILLLYNSFVDDVVKKKAIARLFQWVGTPILLLHFMGLLDDLIAILESISFGVGNIRVSAYGIARVAIFGSLLFWLGRLTAKTGREVISKQEDLDIRTREVFTKLLEIGVFFLVFILILQVMGINLTALAVFGGALGVGLGFGLQAIASNFISGVIILLDRSVAIGDYVELEDGRTGIVRELSLRSTTLETFDGKDIVVPNEKFIVNTFTNWTHKDSSQRYRVDFSVAYDTDIRKLVDIIKEVVASHPQVFSGEDLPIEMRPDCEIDSFGDSGINMFVEFWMEGIDDGKNRVGGDLLLMIFEAMREHGFVIPFPQREVRVLNESFSVSSPKRV